MLRTMLFASLLISACTVACGALALSLDGLRDALTHDLAMLALDGRD